MEKCAAYGGIQLNTERQSVSDQSDEGLYENPSISP